MEELSELTKSCLTARIEPTKRQYTDEEIKHFQDAYYLPDDSVDTCIRKLLGIAYDEGL